MQLEKSVWHNHNMKGQIFKGKLNFPSCMMCDDRIIPSYSHCIQSSLFVTIPLVPYILYCI